MPTHLKQIEAFVVLSIMELGMLNKIERELKHSKNSFSKEDDAEESENNNFNTSLGNYFSLNNNNFSVSTIDWLNSQYRI